MSAYNGLNSVKTNLEKAGICQIDGLRLSNPKCTHATPAQIAATIRMDADTDFMQAHKDQARLCNAIILDVQPRLEMVLDLCSDIDDQNGELTSRTDNHVDEVDANNWQLNAIAEEAAAQDWKNQVTELRGG